MKCAHRFMVHGLALGAAPMASLATTVHWSSWTQGSTQSGSATVGALGTVVGTVAGSSTTVNANFPIRFDSPGISPVNAPSIAMQNPFQQAWSFSVDFTGLSSTAGVVVGLGNFGHSAPTYSTFVVSAFDTGGLPMALTGLQTIGSFDHTWTLTGQSFNDDVALNTTTGAFQVTTVPGLNDFHSDILLLALPAGLGRLDVRTLGTHNGDSTNVLVGIVPLPSAGWLAGAAGFAGLGLYRRRAR